MKTTIDYSKSPSPAFDALQDVIEFLGPRWNTEVHAEMRKVTDPDQFRMWADFAGVSGFRPVSAWYDHYHGENAYVTAGGF